MSRPGTVRECDARIPGDYQQIPCTNVAKAATKLEGGRTLQLCRIHLLQAKKWKAQGRLEEMVKFWWGVA